MTEPAKPPVTRCGGCGEVAQKGDPHRRGRCRRCYERWVRSKPVGLGALCLGCGERRVDALRHFELHRSWVVLCHSCAARADRISPLPRSVAGLRLRLSRDRRHGDRRAEAVGATRRPRGGGGERRANDRRLGLRDAVDLTALAEIEPAMTIELTAEFAGQNELADPDDAPITDLHRLADPAEL